MKVTRTERLLNLVIALLAAEYPVSRAMIQQSVAGYDPSATVAAFERMFERDKDELRGMGVPIRTITDSGGEVQGYLIDSEDYEQQTVDLSVDELSVLAVAARVWDEAVLAPAAVTALRKLEATNSSQRIPVPPQTFGSLAITEAAFLPLLRAVREHRVVTFEYRKPGESEAGKREIEPWSISSQDGHWYLRGWDTDRGEMRSFRLSRITGQVTLTSKPCSVTPRDSADDVAVDEADEVEAIVVIPEGTGAELRRLSGSHLMEGNRWRLRAPRRDLAAMLLRTDPSVVLEGPRDLQSEVASALETLAMAHE